MENKKGLSIIEAFMALDELDDLYEGKSFSLYNNDDIEKAKQFTEEINQEEKEVELQVIDVNADSLEHLKQNKEYIGQAIIQCNACKATRFIDMEELQSSENDVELYNLGLECPYCHSDSNGYSLIGQVGKMVEEEPEIENDETPDEEEATIENDVEEEEVQEEVVEEEPTEEESETTDSLEDDEEQDYMETDAEDDTTEEDDLAESFGTVYDRDDVAWDDTEEYEPIKVITEEVDNLSEEVIQEQPQVILEAIEDVRDFTVEEYFKELFIQPKKLKEITIKDSFNNNVLYKGDYEELTEDILESQLSTFETCGDKLVINVDTTEYIPEKYFNYVVTRYCTNKDYVEVYDVASTDLLAEGSIGDVTDECSHYTVVGIETPRSIEIKILNHNDIQVLNEAKEDLSDETLLIHEIITKNKGEVARIFRPGTWESELANSIREGIDLESIFTEFVLPLKDEILVRLYKEVTGYIDLVDEALSKLGMTINRDQVVFKEEVLTESLDEPTEVIEETEEVIEEDYEYTLLDELVNRYRYQYNKSTHEDIWFNIVADYEDEELANDVLAALEDEYDGHTVDADIYEEFEDDEDDIFEEDMNEVVSEDYDPLLRIEYVCWLDQDGDLGTTIPTPEFELAKEECIRNKFYSVEKQITEIDEEGNPISDMEAEEIWINPDYDPNYNPEEDDDDWYDEEELELDENCKVEESKSFLVSDKLGQSIFECKDRKELSERITECRNNNKPYKVQRSEKEGYRYTVLIEALPATRSSNVTTYMSEHDKEIVKKICRIAKDICDSIETHYDIQADPRLVVSDIIQDLRLISGDLDINELECTPINELTKYLYQAYDGFTQFMNDITRTQRDKARELSIALQALDGPAFTKQAIDKKINSRQFLQAVRTGQIDYVDPIMLESYFIIDREDFTKSINEYLDTFEDDLSRYYLISNVRYDDEENIIVEGILHEEETEKEVQFTLHPTNKLNENYNVEYDYKVTNNFNEDIFGLNLYE